MRCVVRADSELLPWHRLGLHGLCVLVIVWSVTVLCAVLLVQWFTWMVMPVLCHSNTTSGLCATRIVLCSIPVLPSRRLQRALGSNVAVWFGSACHEKLNPLSQPVPW